MARAQNILLAATRNLAAMPADLRAEYTREVPSPETIWPLAVLLASWSLREPRDGADGLDLSPYWPLIDSVAKTYPLLEVFLRRAKDATDDLDFYAAGAIYARLIQSVGVAKLRLLLSQPIMDRIRKAYPMPRNLNLEPVPRPAPPVERLTDSPIRRFDAPRFKPGRKAEPDPVPSSITPIDPELAALPEQDPQTIAAGVLAMRGWSPEQIAEKLKGPKRV